MGIPMSLINQMLQDLERRQGASPQYEPAADEVRSVVTVGTGRKALVAGLVLAAVLLLVATSVMLYPGSAQAPVAAVAPVPARVPAHKPVEAAPTAVAPAQTPAPIVVASTAPVLSQQPAVIATRAVKAQPVPAAAPVPKPQPSPAAAASTAAPTPIPPPVMAVAGEAKPAGATPETLAVKTFSSQQASENLYRNAVLHVQQGRDSAEARAMLGKSLEANPGNIAARQMLASLLMESNDIDGAAALLQEGLKLSPEQSVFSMALARLQLERADTGGAIATLEKGSAGTDRADYHAFYAAVLQRAGRNDDAVKQYLAALRTDPSMPTWLVGIGISLQAIGKDADAIEAFQRAKETGHLAPAVAAFVEQRLIQLRR
jgi:MSHA biogenesis protein MshN